MVAISDPDRPSAPREEGFHDALYDWMRRAPWLLLSAAAHLVVLFVAAAVPWREVLAPPPPPAIGMESPRVPPELADPPPEPLPPVDPVAQPEEPRFVDATESSSDLTASGTIDCPEWSPADATFEHDALLLPAVVGLAGGAGRGPSGHGVGDGPGRGNRAFEAALRDGLAWLAAHQSEDGSWDGDGFDERCGALGAGPCGGAGSAEHDVGLTGLALLAFLGAGSTTDVGPHRDAVRRAAAWLRGRQDPDSGLVGAPSSREFLYDHAIATLALCELHRATRSPLLGRAAQRAVDYAVAARTPWAGWRYDAPSVGESDTSVTGWMVFALAAAREAGLRVDAAAFDGALAWIDGVTDPATGRVGYLQPGGGSSRVRGLNDTFPADGEAMTAVGLLCRVFLGQEPATTPVLERHSQLLVRALPEWSPERGCDMYAWYYGTYALYQMGELRPELWTRWEEALAAALLPAQRADGAARGSWDPVGPWGFSGGRVYATALCTLALEVHYRYARVLGAR